MRHAILAACALLTACGGTVVHDRPVVVKTPVPQPCVASQRPAPVRPLKEAAPGWYDLDIRQKAALVGKQGLDLRTYGEDLNAATGACPAIQPRQ